MSVEPLYRITCWFLLGMLTLFRVTFAVRVRRAGERLMPDEAAIRREGTAQFALRVLAFFLLLGMLAAYVANPPWMRPLEFPFPGWLR